LRYYTTADGLPSNAINYITADPRGFLWFATQQGLSRFDGYTFSNQTTITGLPHNIVTQLLIDRRRNYWLGTASGLVRFQPDRSKDSADRMVLYQPNGQTHTVSTLLEDRRGRIWCGTNVGVFLIDPADGVKARLTEVRVGMPGVLRPDSIVGGLAEDREGSIWIGTSDGKLYRHLAGGSVERYAAAEGLPSFEITDVLIDRKGRFWVGTEVGLYHAAVKPKPGTHVFEPLFGKGDGLPKTRVFMLFESREGDVWASMFQHLAQFPASGTPVRVWGKEHGLPRTILALGQDRDGNLWLGTDDLGAVKQTAGGLLTYTEADGLESNVYSIAETRGGELYAAGHPPLGGLRINVRQGEHFLSVSPNARGVTYFGWRPGHMILQDHAGEWWIATFSGLLRYPPLGRLEQLAHTSPKAVYTVRDGLPNNQVVRLFEDRAGNIWMSTSYPGVTFWDRTTHSFHHIRPDGAADGSAFGQDQAGNVWFGDDAGQLWRVKHESATLIAGRAQRGWINDILLDHAGRLWVATAAKGLLRFDHPEAPHPEFREYGLNDGLFSVNARSLAEDRNGAIYVGTGDGVDRLEPDLAHSRHFTTADGVAPGQVHAAYRDRSGAMWFGTQYGLTQMAPEGTRSGTPPAVWITGLSLGGRPAYVSDAGESSIRRIDVQPGQEHIQFDFVGISFAPGDVLRYQYRMGDEAWSDPILARTVHYGALVPGSYRFQVRAVQADGGASPQPAVVEFRVLPALWRRTWFQVLLLSIVAGAAARIHHARVNRLLELERVRTRIATDLHDDIGSSLSQIAILSEVAQRRSAQGDAGESLQKIGGLSRELLDSISEIVWAIQPHKDRLSDLQHRMRRFASEVLSARNIEMHWPEEENERDVKLDAERRRQVYLIFKESIHNIARHSRATEVRIALQIAGQRLSLEVSDNGCGIDGRHGRGSGLESMELRARKLGAELEMRSQPGQGTTVRLRVALDT
jgi:ligand-binding sensor domain-containing protein/signal transduction histidine kinase